MKFKEFLQEQKTTILEKWVTTALESYSSNFSRFYKKTIDPFTNPVGYNLSRSLNSIYEILSGEVEGGDKELDAIIDDIVRIRAVQEMSPSQAVSFLQNLKPVLRETVDRSESKDSFRKELAVLEEEIDTLLLRAFDLYMGCRERIFQIKLDEIKKGLFLNEPEEAACPSTLMDSWSSGGK